MVKVIGLALPFVLFLFAVPAWTFTPGEHTKKLYKDVQEGNKARKSAVNESGRRKLLVDDDQEAFSTAIARGQNSVFFRLLKKVDLNGFVRVAGSSITPLRDAAVFERDDYIPKLIKAGADPDFAPRGERPPLATAIVTGDTAVVKAFLKGGADPSLGGVLELAVLENEPRMVTLLIKAGADPDEFPDGEVPPILLASYLGNAAVVNALLYGGADTSVRQGGFSVSGIRCLCCTRDPDEFCNCKCASD